MNVHSVRMGWSCSGEEGINGNVPSEIVRVQNETARLQELYRYQVLNTPPEPELNDLTQLAAEICQTSMALISFVDTDRQWFKSRVGVAISETPRYISFCTHAIQQREPLVVPDALLDDRFCQNPIVTDDPKIRFYAGAPLITPAGFILGTLCVVDSQPRELSSQQIKQLQVLSRQVMTHLELKRKTTDSERSQIKFKKLQQQLVEKEKLSQQELILFNLANQIRNSLNLDTILQTAVDEIRKLLKVDYCHFLWCLPDGDRFNLAITHEAKEPTLPGLNGNFDEYEVGIAETICSLQILQVDDVYEADLPPSTQELLMRQGIRSELLLPLKTYSGQLGAIVCSHGNSVHQWTTGEVQILRAVTDQLAIALDQAELFAETRATALAAQTQAQYLAEALQKLQQTQAQLIQHEKMSSLGQLVAGVAHEINNPVNFIGGNITYATDYINDLLRILKLYQEHYPDPAPPIQEMAENVDLEFITEDLPQLLSSMKMGVERIYQIVLSLRNFSRLDEAEMKPVNLHEGLENTLLILQNRLKRNKAGVTIEVLREYENLPQVECSAGQLNQVFMNLFSNAIDALDEVPGNPTITVSTELIACPIEDTLGRNSGKPADCASHVIIRIRDNGCGIPEEVRNKVFNPFFTTKPVGKGTGLGLSISYQIVVEKHHGTIECISEPGKGTEFRIQIPVQSIEMRS